MASFRVTFANIEIQAIYGSHSGWTFCLLILPIAVWDMVKRNDEFSFIAYVESNNLLNNNAFHAKKFRNTRKVAWKKVARLLLLPCWLFRGPQTQS